MGEILDVVDEDDKVIGQFSREKCHSYPDKIHRSISIFIFDKDGKMLVQKRSDSKDLYPNLFCSSCSGHVSSGEDYIFAALRELKEELDISIDDSKIKEIAKVFVPVKFDMAFHKLFLLDWDGNIDINKKEITSVKWYDISDLEQEMAQSPGNFTPAFIALFTKYLETLKKENETSE